MSSLLTFAMLTQLVYIHKIFALTLGIDRSCMLADFCPRTS